MDDYITGALILHIDIFIMFILVAGLSAKKSVGRSVGRRRIR
jgi:hypothetical protein